MRANAMNGSHYRPLPDLWQVALAQNVHLSYTLLVLLARRNIGYTIELWLVWCRSASPHPHSARRSTCRLVNF